MDREIPIANRVVDRKMQEFRSRKHRQTLSQIRNKSNSMFHTTMYQQTPKHNRYSSSFIENKNLEIEKQNIKLFNKIASIIRQKPKIPSHNSSYSYSCENANIKHRKNQQRIKTQNQILQKRISQQKPTIQNKQFFKDRRKNVKYLKLIGRFPYEKKRNLNQQALNSGLPTMRSVGDSQLPTDIEIYRKKTDNFFVRITKINSNYYVFTVQIQDSQKIFQYTMRKQMYEQQFMRCGYNYDQLIGRLRLTQKLQVVFDEVPGPQHSAIHENHQQHQQNSK